MKYQPTFSELSAIESYLKHFEMAQQNLVMVSREDRQFYNKRWVKLQARRPRKLLTLMA